MWILVPDSKIFNLLPATSNVDISASIRSIFIICLGCHSDVPITHGPNLSPLKSGSDAPIMYSLKFTSVVCYSNIPIRYSPDLTPMGMPW